MRHCHSQDQGVLGKMAYSGSGKRRYKMIVGHLLESKNVLKKWWGHVKGTPKLAWRGSHQPDVGQISIKNNNDGNGGNDQRVHSDAQNKKCKDEESK